MAIHDLGYRSWTGTRSGGTNRWWVIASTGIQRAWQSPWLRRMIGAAWLPAFFYALGFFFWEKSLITPGWTDFIRMFVQAAPSEIAEVAKAGFQADNIAEARHGMWSWLLFSFFRRSQAVLMVAVIGLIAPRLISQDIRSRAFLLYFSRPLSRIEYVVGKFVTVVFYLMLISTIPAIMLYLLGILLSPSTAVFWQTWDLPLRIMAASAVLAIPTAGLALCLSSLTQESRIAGFAWFAIWVLGWMVHGSMSTVETFQHAYQQNQAQAAELAADRWANFSLYHLLGRVQSWVFGFNDFSEIASSFVLWTIVTVVTLVVLFRRVAAPMRA